MWHSVTLVLINVQFLFKKMQSTFENFNIWQKSNLVLTKIVNFKHNKYFGVKVYLKRKINGIARREAMLVYLKLGFFIWIYVYLLCETAHR